MYVVTTDPNVNVYLDSACTNLTTSIDFGNIQQGAFEAIRLYIKNEGGGDVFIYWNSTVASDTSGKLGDWWTESPYYDRSAFGKAYSNWNGTLLESGVVMTTYYMILVDLDTPLSSHSWTLYVGVA